MSVRNFEEYRAEVLEGLGATTEDIRNEASWRAKVLEALGAEYTDEDTRNFERYRLKVLENLSGGGGSGGGGGGSSWQTVFEGSVTTTAHTMPGGETVYTGFIDTDNPIESDTIKVTFNGVEYTCPLMDNEYYGAPYDEGTDSVDWSEYPFTIQPNGLVETETAGTYTLKIEEQSGGGSSDFSTAEVTITNTSEKSFRLEFPNIYEDVMYSYLDSADIDGSSVTVALYKGECQVGFASEYPATDFNIAVTGDIEMVMDVPVIKGNGTITIS